MQQHVEKWVGVVAAGARRRPRRLRRRLRGQGERRRFRDVIADVFGAEVLQLALVRGPPGPRFQNVRSRVGPGVPENSIVIVFVPSAKERKFGPDQQLYPQPFLSNISLNEPNKS